MGSTNKHIRICHVNCQSLTYHLDEFRLFFGRNHFDVICISESWLLPSISDNFIALPGYNIIRCDRTGDKRGGGVALYVSLTLKVKVLATSEGVYQGKPEFLIVEIASNSDKLLLATVYRPPKTGFLHEFENTLLELFTDYSNLVVFGDFNANLCTSTYDSGHLREFLDSSNLHLVPYEPTYHLENSSTWLDICAVDDAEKLISFGQRDVSFLSAHDLVFIEYNVSVERNTSKQVTARDYRNFDHDRFMHDLSVRCWGSIAETDCLDSKTEIFNSLLTQTLDANAPLRSFTAHRNISPWFTPDIKALLVARDKARRTWRRKKTSATYSSFKKLRNQAKQAIKTAKQAYFHLIFDNVRSDKETWSQLRTLGLIRNKVRTLPLTIPPEVLNIHFADVSGTPTPTHLTESSVSDLDLGNSGYSDGKFYLTNPTHEELIRALSTSTSRSAGVDGLRIEEIKRATPIISDCILHLFSFSITYEVYPTLWKRALIRPIAKTKNPLSASDYRPISLLCSLSKILEKIVASQITRYLEEANKMDPFQSAYRKGHNTQTALLRTLDKARLAADGRRVTVMVFFDFSKAFDRVIHSKLIGILESLGFSGSALRWVHSYLTGRSQSVLDHDNNSSSWTPTSSGVPQGSVLGPLLFSLYISGFREVLSFCDYSVYADDIQIFLSCHPKDIASCVAKINEDIKSITRWADDLGLLLNDAKTKAMIVGTSRYVNSINLAEILPVRVHDTELPYSRSVEYLGKILASNLTWSMDARRTCKKVFSILHQLKSAKHLLPRDIRGKLISTLVFPHLDYCSVAMLDISKESESLLQRSLNSCVRFIVNSRRSEHITPHFAGLRWLKLRERRRYLTGCLLFHIMNTGTPRYLSDKINLRSTTAIHCTRTDPHTLAVPQCRTELYKASFFCSGPAFWNSLPLRIRSTSSFHDFRTKLFDHLLKTYDC